MARPHSLMVWSVVFGFLAAASLFAAEAKEPKQKHAKAPAAKSTSYRSDDPFAGPEELSAPAAKPNSHPFARPEKHAVPSAKKPPRPAVKELRPGENVARIEAALASPTELNFVETPLQDVVDFLKAQHHIEIKIDNKALQDVGIGTDTPVTVNLKGISLRSALNLMLKELSLTWIVADEVLLITTPEEADNRLDTKVYDVADLVSCRDEHDVPWEDYETLIDVITSTIKPASFDCQGGAGSINGATLGTAKVLVVSQTREVHEQIADLLARIREIAKKNSNAGTPRRDKPTPFQYGSVLGTSRPAQKEQPRKPDASKNKGRK